MSIASLASFGGSIGGLANSVGKLGADITALLDGKTRQASWNGLPFALLSQQTSAGRKIALHEYPFRDESWAEDLGQKSRRFQVLGFLIENSVVYGGGSVTSQNSNMLKQLEVAGPGTFVHPLLGSLQVTCLDAVLGTSWDAGRVVEVRFTFVEGGARIFPETASSTQNAVAAAAGNLNSGSLLDFVKSTATALTAGASVVKMAVSTAVGWFQVANNLVHDVTRVFNAVSTLSGNFGVMFGAGNSGYSASNINTNSSATASSLLAADVANVAALSAAGTALTSAAESVSDTASYAAAAQAMVAALAATASSPADSVRLLSGLAAFAPSASTTASVVGDDMAAMQSASAALFRRAAIAELAVASTSYQPASASDAITVRNAIVDIIDSEILTAGATADDNSYSALRSLRQAVVSDLTSRGAQLPSMAQFDFSASLPSLVLAQRIYQDASREPQLVRQASPIHPAFMPTSFSALAD